MEKIHLPKTNGNFCPWKMVKWWNERRCFWILLGPGQIFEGGERAKKPSGVFSSCMWILDWGTCFAMNHWILGGNSIVFCWASRPCSNWPIGQKRNFNCTSVKNSSLTWWICIWNSLRFSKSKASPRKGESHSFPCWMVWVWGDMTWWFQPCSYVNWHFPYKQLVGMINGVSWFP